MKNCLYLKTFENGSLYVGITNNFNRRMKDHERACLKGDTKLIYRVMRKYNHITDVLIESNSREYILHMERVVIQNFKDLGYHMLNMTDGGDGVLKPIDEVVHKLKEANKKSQIVRQKPIEYYESNAISIKDFKIICKNRNLNFDNFIYIRAKLKNGSCFWFNKNKIYENKRFNKLLIVDIINGISIKRKIEIKNKDIIINKNLDLLIKYENTPCSKTSFLNCCKILGFDPNKFEKKSHRINLKTYLFTYKYVGFYHESNINKYENKLKECEYMPISRSRFKDICKSRNISIDDFIEIENENCYISPSGYTKKKYTYIKRV